MVIAVMGLPGSGKSYFASRLAKRLNARYLSSDIIRKELLCTQTYSEEEKLRVYDAMIQKLSGEPSQAPLLVLDATFSKQPYRDRLKQAVASLERPLHFIEIQAEPAIIKARISKKRVHSDADFSVYQLLKKSFDPMEEDHLILQSTQDNIEEMLSQAIQYLQEIHE